MCTGSPVVFLWASLSKTPSPLSDLVKYWQIATHRTLTSLAHLPSHWPGYISSQQAVPNNRRGLAQTKWTSSWFPGSKQSWMDAISPQTLFIDNHFICSKKNMCTENLQGAVKNNCFLFYKNDSLPLLAPLYTGFVLDRGFLQCLIILEARYIFEVETS